MAHHENHLIAAQRDIEMSAEEPRQIAIDIIEAERNGDTTLRQNLAKRFICQGKTLLDSVKDIQDRYHYLMDLDIEPTFDMTWLYVTAMKAMQDTYDNGIMSIHLQLVKEWPELTQWLKDRIKR